MRSLIQIHLLHAMPIKNKTQSKFIGVDVGGTKILLQTFDSKWRLVNEKKVLTEVKKGQAGFLKQLTALIDEFFHSGIKSIGVAVPGIVDHEKGILVKPPHLPAKNLKLKDILTKAFRCPIVVDNDVNAFLYAQHQRPQLQKYRHLVAVMVGTGVGGAIMIDGKLVYGKRGFAGEVGHMVLQNGSKLSTFEQNTSGFFIPKIARELGIKGFKPSNLANSTSEAKKVKKHLIEHLGIGLSNLNLIFNPEVFVLGGSIYQHFLSDHKKELQKIIASRALDAKSPLLVDADQRHTAAMGAGMMAAK